mmetsp:Transcript_17923/g.38974  ORF Transcript_17923/g.38974 Transcript_17923/m.38974 type:complete len:310 (+) Transcript_17923:409-1338(+)
MNRHQGKRDGGQSHATTIVGIFHNELRPHQERGGPRHGGTQQQGPEGPFLQRMRLERLLHGGSKTQQGQQIEPNVKDIGVRRGRQYERRPPALLQVGEAGDKPLLQDTPLQSGNLPTPKDGQTDRGGEGQGGKECRALAHQGEQIVVRIAIAVQQCCLWLLLLLIGVVIGSHTTGTTNRWLLWSPSCSSTRVIIVIGLNVGKVDFIFKVVVVAAVLLCCYRVVVVVVTIAVVVVVVVVMSVVVGQLLRLLLLSIGAPVKIVVVGIGRPPSTRDVVGIQLNERLVSIAVVIVVIIIIIVRLGMFGCHQQQ